MTETELLHNLAVKASRGDQDYQADDIFRLLEVTRRMKNQLEHIATMKIESPFQTCMVKAIAREGLYPHAKS